VAIVVSLPPGQTRLGPGYLCGAVISSGPVPNDDIVEVNVHDAATGFIVVTGAAFTKGALTNYVVLDYRTAFGFTPGVQAFVAAGGAIYAVAVQYHRNGTLVAISPNFNTLWDPVGAAAWLAGSASYAVHGQVL